MIIRSKMAYSGITGLMLEETGAKKLHDFYAYRKANEFPFSPLTTKRRWGGTFPLRKRSRRSEPELVRRILSGQLKLSSWDDKVTQWILQQPVLFFKILETIGRRRSAFLC